MSLNKAGVSFEGAEVVQVTQQRLDSILQEQQRARDILEAQNQAQERQREADRIVQQQEAKRRAQQDQQNSIGGQGPPYNHNGGNGGGGRMSPNDNLPGRLSSQFDFRSEGNPSYRPIDDSRYSAHRTEYAMVTEQIYSNGTQVTVSLGTNGAVWEVHKERNNGKMERVSHTTLHKAGNVHFHPDENDKTKDYFGAKPKVWYEKNGMLAKVIDKGAKPE